MTKRATRKRSIPGALGTNSQSALVTRARRDACKESTPVPAQSETRLRAAIVVADIVCVAERVREGDFHAALAAAPTWEHDALDAAVREVAESNSLKLGKLAQPLRAALTGKTTSPGIFDVLVLLGKDESLARIADQLVEPTE